MGSGAGDDFWKTTTTESEPDTLMKKTENHDGAGSDGITTEGTEGTEVTLTAPTEQDAEYRSARNKGDKEPSEEALANEGQRINVPFVYTRWDAVLPSDFDRNTMRWFHQHALDRGLSRTAIAQIIGKSPTTAYRVMAGTYEGRFPMDKLRMYRQAVLESAQIARSRAGSLERQPDWVETGPAGMFLEALDLASRGGMALCAGRSGIGKTWAAEKWTMAHPGRLIRVNAPTMGGATALVQEVADKMGIGWRNLSGSDVKRRIEKQLAGVTPTPVIMVDQGSRLIPDKKRLLAAPWEVLMDFNEAGIGIVVAITWRNIGMLDALAYQMEQVQSRSRTFCAPELTPAETAAVARQWNAEFSGPSLERLHEVALSPGGLREMVGLLNDLERAGKKLRRPMSDELLRLVIEDRKKRTRPPGEMEMGKSERGTRNAERGARK